MLAVVYVANILWPRYGVAGECVGNVWGFFSTRNLMVILSVVYVDGILRSSIKSGGGNVWTTFLTKDQTIIFAVVHVTGNLAAWDVP